MRRALIVGIDDYPSQPLQGCVNDANRMGTILARNEDGSPNFDCRLMTAPETTVSRPLLRQSIKELFEHPADVAWFHFSGHGFLNNHDGYLVTQDANTFDEGVLSQIAFLKVSKGLISIFGIQELPILLGFSNLRRD